MGAGSNFALRNVWLPPESQPVYCHRLFIRADLDTPELDFTIWLQLAVGKPWRTLAMD